MRLYKLIFVIFLLFLSTTNAFSQATMPASTKAFFNEINSQRSNLLNKDFEESFCIRAIGDKKYAHALIYVEGLQAEKLTGMGVFINSRIGNIWSIHFPLETAAYLQNEPTIKHIEIGVQAAPMLEAELKDVKADVVHNGELLSKQYKGKGVIVAVIDWGFDYTHPVFYDTSLTSLRISRAWDQNKIAGTPPAGYSYGAEYIGQAELLAAKHDTDYVFGPQSHGTHVAGIAGGNGGGTKYIGIAPESELVIISLLRTSASLIDAFTYIADYAASVNKPFVVNMSFGSHLGPHDGTLLENLAMDQLAGPGRVFVGSAGNNGNNNFHIKAQLNSVSDTARTFIDFASHSSYANLFGQAIPIWGGAGESFKAALTIYDKSGNVHCTTDFYNSQDSPSLDTVIYIGSDSILVKMAGVSENFINNKPSMVFQISNRGQYPVALALTSNSAAIHAWNIIRLNNRFTNWGVSFMGSHPLVTGVGGYIAGDMHYGLGEPAGVGKEVITVGAYRAERVSSTGVLQHGQIANFSSYGPTVDERVKPDITGPGVNVASSVSSWVTGGTPVTSVNFNGRVYRFESYSGTSMSGPVVAGVVALMLEVNPNLSAQQVKEILKNTARQDQHTGTLPSTGHNTWGWGKVNALEAVIASGAQFNTVPLTADILSVKAYPNPTRGLLTISMGQNTTQAKVSVINLTGQVLKTIAIPGNSATETIDLSYLETGFYFLKIEADGKTGVAKFQMAR
jgi:minor extracellular serine protease Vpr